MIKEYGTPVNGDNKDKIPKADNRDEKSEINEITLDESKRELLTKKMAEYKARVESAEQSGEYWNANAQDFWKSYYDSLAKLTTAELLLADGKVNKQTIDKYLNNTSKEHLDEIFSVKENKPVNIFQNHARIFVNAVKNAFRVVDSYNK